MKEIIGFIRQYIKWIDRPVFWGSTLFVIALIWLNYSQGLEYVLTQGLNLPYGSITGRVLLYAMAFIVPYLLISTKGIERSNTDRGFIVCLILAPIIFAIKAGMGTHLTLSADSHWNQYWNDILYWPLRVVLMVILLFICWKLFHSGESFYGLSAHKLKVRPYLIMLLIMVPLVAAASTQPDFLTTYPKMKEIIPLPDDAQPGWLYKLLFELSYGSDFLSIELFFRGFLVIGFMKWMGKDAILPMACFYCTIHFGKPLGECISSYFGGLLLGIVSYHTRSIYGGLMVHLGIAWLMELGGYIGNSIKW